MSTADKVLSFYNSLGVRFVASKTYKQFFSRQAITEELYTYDSPNVYAMVHLRKIPQSDGSISKKILHSGLVQKINRQTLLSHMNVEMFANAMITAEQNLASGSTLQQTTERIMRKLTKGSREWKKLLRRGKRHSGDTYLFCGYNDRFQVNIFDQKRYEQLRGDLEEASDSIKNLLSI